MKKMMVVAMISLSMVLMSIPAAFALELGSNITIWDGSYNPTSTNSWHNTENEDQEVEPGCTSNQSWDLEGFFLNGDILTMVGGFDFADATQTFPSGDIFLDVNGDYSPDSSPTSTNGNGVVLLPNSYGYDYALDLDFNAVDSQGNPTPKYTVYSLDGDSTLHSVYYAQNRKSTPWEYVSGGSKVGTYDLQYSTGLYDSEVAGLLGDTAAAGGTHNAVAVDLGFLAHGTNFTSHFTMRCGNDNLMGQGTVVPEPQTLLLMGIGLLGLAFIGRKKLAARAS